MLFLLQLFVLFILIIKSFILFVVKSIFCCDINAMFILCKYFILFAINPQIVID